MVFDYNEWLHKMELLSNDRYITAFEFAMSMVVALILVIGFYKIVVKSQWFEKHQKIMWQKVLPAAVILFGITELLFALWIESLQALMVGSVFVALLLVVALRKEFAAFRAYLNEKIGWIF
jgi:phosphoglycerol transferase MdoB-like AlkP superfamily enzyme